MNWWNWELSMFSCVKTGGAKGEEANNPYTNLRHTLNIRLIYVKRQHCFVDMCFTRVWTLFIFKCNSVTDLCSGKLQVCNIRVRPFRCQKGREWWGFQWVEIIFSAGEPTNTISLCLFIIPLYRQSSERKRAQLWAPSADISWDSLSTKLVLPGSRQDCERHH